RSIYRFSSGTTAWPSATASKPPGQKSFCTSTTSRASFITPLLFEASRLLLGARVEAVERGGPVLADFARLQRLLQDARRQQLLAEVALIEAAIEDRLVDLL